MYDFVKAIFMRYKTLIGLVAWLYHGALKNDFIIIASKCSINSIKWLDNRICPKI